MAERQRVQFGYVKEHDAMIVGFLDRYGQLRWLQDENGDTAIVAAGLLGSHRKDEFEQTYLHIDEVFRELE